MKKPLIISAIALASISLFAYGFTETEETNSQTSSRNCCLLALESNPLLDRIRVTEAPMFIYEVESRFNTRISKSDLMNASDLHDIVPKEEMKGKESFSLVKFAVLTEEGELNELAVENKFTKAQKDLIQTLDYSDNFYVMANCENRIESTGELENYRLVYYLTVIPEQEASYSLGLGALESYFKKGSKSVRDTIDFEFVRPARIEFWVSTEGKITDARIDSPSSYADLDNKMLDLVQAMPGDWEPAKDAQGNAVAQKMVFFYGKKGC